MPATHSCPSLRGGKTCVGDTSNNEARIKQSKNPNRSMVILSNSGPTGRKVYHIQSRGPDVALPHNCSERFLYNWRGGLSGGDSSVTLWRLFIVENSCCDGAWYLFAAAYVPSAPHPESSELSNSVADPESTTAATPGWLNLGNNSNHRIPSQISLRKGVRKIRLNECAIFNRARYPVRYSGYTARTGRLLPP